MTSSAANPVDAQVFISYAQDEDGARALEIADHLEAAGISVWIADRSIEGAQNYGPEVVGAIDRCRVLAVLCSVASLHSGHVAVEVELAFEAKRPRLPLRLDDTPFPDQIRYWLTGSNWIDVTGPAEEWVPKVVRALEWHGVERRPGDAGARDRLPAAPGPGAPTAPVLPIGEVEYAQSSDGTHVAYRVIEAARSCAPGTDVVMSSGGLFPMEHFEGDPGFVRLLDGLRSIGRVVVFDRRGLGLSDPITSWDRPILDQWADDLQAVVDASGARDAVVFAWDSYGVGSRFAARHPDRHRLLVLHEPYWVPEEQTEAWGEERNAIVRGNLAGEKGLLGLIAPSRVDDPSFRDWYLRAGRAGASPTTAARIWDSTFASQPGDQLLEQVATPTLVLLRRDSAYFPVDAVRAAAARIDGATIAELDGADHFPFLGDVDAVVAAIADFVARALPPPQHVLAAVLRAEPLAAEGGSGDEGRSTAERVETTVREAVADCGGEVVPTEDSVLAILPSAYAAVRAARRTRDDLAAAGLDARIGVHVGDIDRRDGAVTGPGAAVVAAATAGADPGHVVVTASVAASVPGGTAAFTSVGRRELPGLAGEWELFAL
jgi:pimeloyl-ACP methyl ester carboxylesterase